MVAVFGAAIFAYTVVRAVYYSPDLVAMGSLPEIAVASTAEKPVHLEIPSLGIDAKVQYVGINGRKEMAVPSNFRDVGWYKYGPVPGQRGSAVIDGHVDNGLGLPAVFNRLGEIKTGADVFVTTKDGARLRFVVVDVRSYPYEEAPKELVFEREDAAWLNLITCSGDWIKSKRTYSLRIVVYTKYVESS